MNFHEVDRPEVSKLSRGGFYWQLKATSSGGERGEENRPGVRRRESHEENSNIMWCEEAPKGRGLKRRSAEGPHICCQEISAHHQLGGERRKPRGKLKKERAGGERNVKKKMYLKEIATDIHTRKCLSLFLCVLFVMTSVVTPVKRL